jgi:tetratricopeptide (TPR) repeat protein
LYNTDERLLDVVAGPPGNYTRFLVGLQQIIAIDLTNDERSTRYIVLKRVKELEQGLKEGRLARQDRVNLSAYYIRLNEPEKAIALLEAMPRQQRDFMAYSNLATAYQLTGNLARAETFLTEALENWPKVSTETSSQFLNFLRMAERYHLKLITSRQREQANPRGSPASIDAIFPDLRLVGPSGEYEPGLLAAEQWVRLPPYYREIVKLLVLWLPHDTRLRWLLAEIVNINGDPASAQEMMDDLAWSRRFGNPEFDAHLHILRSAKDVAARLARLRPSLLREKVSTPLAPLAGLLPAVPGTALDAVNTIAALEKISKEPLPSFQEEPSPLPESPATTPTPSSGWTPEWRQIAVSFVAGAFVAALLSLQLREMRKRRQDAQPASQE